MFRIGIALTVIATCSSCALGAPESPPRTQPATDEPIRYAPSRKLCNLVNRQINESSGLACSRRTPSVFWTHNDSGDEPVLYAFDAKGRDLSAYRIAGARAVDWEDMASFDLDGQSFLLIADVGDNERRRLSCELYIVREPEIVARKGDDPPVIQLAQAIRFVYKDGAQDCEAVAVDPMTRTIYLITKQLGTDCRAYTLPVPRTPSAELAVAQPVARLRIPMATAMDMSPDGLRLIVATYGPSYEWTRRAEQTWAEAFGRSPRVLNMPMRRQGESICYGRNGRTLYLTSEKLPTPLFQVPSRRRAPTTQPDGMMDTDDEPPPDEESHNEP